MAELKTERELELVMLCEEAAQKLEKLSSFEDGDEIREKAKYILEGSEETHRSLKGIRNIMRELATSFNGAADNIEQLLGER
jgi:hypothetical protein